MRRCLFILAAILTMLQQGCTNKIQIDVLNIERFLSDIPKELNLGDTLYNCIIEINASRDYNKKEFINELFDSNGYGTLCIPKVDSATIYVYTTEPTYKKQIEFKVCDNKIMSLKLWKDSQLVCDVQGSMGRDRLSGKYYFLSGNQTIRDYPLFIERISNYIDTCENFVEREKRYIQRSDYSYYKITEKEYDNIDYEVPIYEINYRDTENEKYGLSYRIKSIKYEDESGEEMPLERLLFIEDLPYIIYKTSIIENGWVTYMALFNGESASNGQGDGIFFSSNEPDLRTIRCGHTFHYGIRYDRKIQITNKVYYEPLGPLGRYDISLDSLSNLVFNGHPYRHDHVSMTKYDVPYDSWLEEVLQQKVQAEDKIEMERIKLSVKISKDSGNSIVYTICSYCNGVGKIPITGGGLVLSVQTCPQCNGVGKVYDISNFIGDFH